MRHADITPGFVHTPFNWVYATATARLAATGFQAGDINKIAIDLDTAKLSILAAVSGGGAATWTGISATLPTLDAIPAPAANVSLNGKKITGLADATAGTDALNRETADGRYDLAGAAATVQAAAVQKASNLSDLPDSPTARANLRIPMLQHVQCVAQSNQARSGALPTIDGYAVQDGDRVLLAGQTTASQNGVWIAHTSGWVRPNDYPATGVIGARATLVTSGVTWASTLWELVSGASITIDTTGTTWQSVGRSAGTGLVLTGNSLAPDFGTGAGKVAQGNDSRITGAAQAASNLSDLASVATARTNLGLGSAATQASTAFDAAGAAATAQAASAQKSANLSDLASAATALANLGALAAANQQLAVVSSDITISSQATLQNITGLALTLGASATEIWLVKFWILLNGANGTMDAKFGFGTMPTGATLNGGPIGSTSSFNGWQPQTTAGTPLAIGTAATSHPVGTGAAVTNGIPFIFIVFGGGTAGSVQFQFAQNTSDAGNLVIKRGSIMEATKVAA